MLIGTEKEQAAQINEQLSKKKSCHMWFGTTDREQIIAAAVNERGRLIIKLVYGYWIEPGPGARIELF